MGGREYVGQISIGDITIYEVTSDPDGILAGKQGDLAVRSDAANVYQNTNGGTSWAKQNAGLGLVASLAASVAINGIAFVSQASVSIDLSKLSSDQVGVWMVEESWISNGSILSNFRSKLTVGPGADPLTNNSGMFQTIPAIVNDALLFHRSTRVMIRPQGGGFLVDVSGIFTFPDAVTILSGETGPDDLVSDQIFTIPGNMVIGSSSRFDAAGSEVTLRQFNVIRIA